MANERLTPAEAIAEATKRGAAIRDAAARAAQILRDARAREQARDQAGETLASGQGT